MQQLFARYHPGDTLPPNKVRKHYDRYYITYYLNQAIEKGYLTEDTSKGKKVYIVKKTN